MTSFYCRKNDNGRPGLKRRVGRALSAFISLSIILLTGCAKEPVQIGIGLLPEGDFVAAYATDTIGVKAYTMYNDMAVTSNSAEMIAGSVYDKYFGTTDCDFVTQLRLVVPWGYSDVIVDSVFFNFLISDVAGDTAATHYIRLYETGTTLYDSLTYYSGQSPDTIFFLGEYPMPVLKADSSYSVRLDNMVGEHLLRDTTQFIPAAEFYTDFFKGLYFGIRSETNPVLVTMQAADNPLDITVYYHASETDTIRRSYSFVATERAVNYNRYFHDFSTAEPDKMIRHINDLVLDTAVYMQNYWGVYSRLDLPSLLSFRSVERLAVNKARLYVPVHIDGTDFLKKNLPDQIYLRYRNEEGTELVVPDLLHDVTFLDGTFHDSDSCYVFNITSFVQQYLEGDIVNPSVEMYFPSSVEQNTIFKANGNSPTVRFEFAYTIY